MTPNKKAGNEPSSPKNKKSKQKKSPLKLSKIFNYKTKLILLILITIAFWAAGFYFLITTIQDIPSPKENPSDSTPVIDLDSSTLLEEIENLKNKESLWNDRPYQNENPTDDNNPTPPDNNPGENIDEIEPGKGINYENTGRSNPFAPINN